MRGIIESQRVGDRVRAGYTIERSAARDQPDATPLVTRGPARLEAAVPFPAVQRPDRLERRRRPAPATAPFSCRPRVPACAYAILPAIPLAVALAAMLLTAVGARELYARWMGVALPASDPASLIAIPAVEPTAGGEPMSIDPARYESIRRTEYTVKPGDTISEIAYAFDLHPGTLLSINPIDDVRRLLPGTVLSIPDRDGLFHAVQPGESLDSISRAYSAGLAAILDANGLQTDVLQIGDALFIPGARMNEDRYLLAIGELFQWPLRSFRFTSRYGMRIHPFLGTWHFHNGIDITNAVGTPVLAARAGRVVHIESQPSNYGLFVILDHGDGFRTMYAHLDSIAVRLNERVTTSQLIGRLGSTGRSTGPHLHFSVINRGRWEDPLRHLPSR